jgi:hypothetical protein
MTDLDLPVKEILSPQPLRGLYLTDLPCAKVLPRD